MKKDTSPYFGIVFAGTLVRAFVFTLYIRGLHVYPAVEGMQVGFWAGLGSASYSPLYWVLGAALFSCKKKDLVWSRVPDPGRALAGRNACKTTMT